jgi:hypothetical protein
MSWNWKKVEDELPECWSQHGSNLSSGDVLVMDASGDCYVTDYWIEGEYTENGWVKKNEGWGEKDVEITHWCKIEYPKKQYNMEKDLNKEELLKKRAEIDLLLRQIEEQEKPLFSSVVVHAHPIVEFQIRNFKKQEDYWSADCFLYNVEEGELESHFFLSKELAEDLIEQFQKFVDNCK